MVNIYFLINMRYLVIVIKVQDGDYEHDHRCLHTTNCKSLKFAAEYYTAHFWGYGHRTGTDYWIWQNGCIAGKLEKYTEVTEEEFRKLENMFY